MYSRVHATKRAPSPRVNCVTNKKFLHKKTTRHNDPLFLPCLATIHQDQIQSRRMCSLCRDCDFRLIHLRNHLSCHIDDQMERKHPSCTDIVCTESWLNNVSLGMSKLYFYNKVKRWILKQSNKLRQKRYQPPSNKNTIDCMIYTHVTKYGLKS